MVPDSAKILSALTMNMHIKPTEIKFTKITYSVNIAKTKEKKEVLKSISGNFKPSELTAIMGPSGSGKTTLLNILTGFIKKNVTGNILMGSPSKKNRKLCSYILQDDNLFPWFTVEESMIMAATLKIANSSLNSKEKRLLISNILESLHLNQCRQTKCSELSGGQKKRLSIALELLDNPPILLLDEPTTGLDSSACADCITLLRTLSREGRTIVCTIHQPSATVYQLFDHVYAMADGYCLYQGSPTNTLPFLRSIGLECPQYHNTADYLLEVINKEHGDFTIKLCEEAKFEKWRILNKQGSVLDTKLVARTTTEAKTLSADRIKHIYPPPEWMKLWILIGRCHIQFYRDWTVTHLKLALHVFCSILIGLLFGDSGSNASKAISNIALFIVGIVYLWYTTVMPGVLRFPLEMATIKKETFNNWYKLRTYYLASLITSTPVHIIFSSCFSTIVYLMTSQPLELIRYVKFAFTLILTTITADGFGMLLGTLLNPVNGTFFGAVTACFMLIYAGFLVLYEHMPAFMKYFGYFSCHKFALEGLVLSVYGGNRHDMVCPKNMIYCHFKKADLILKTLGMSTDNYAMDILLILFQLSLFKGLTYFTLRRAVQAN